MTPANDASDSNPQPLFDYIVDQLNALKLVYIHVIEGATGGPRDVAPFDYASLRKRFKGAYIANNGYDFELATKVLAADAADLIAFGKPFIANPDLVERLREGAPLNTPDKATFYGGGAKGYTDYPALGEALDAARSRDNIKVRHSGTRLLAWARNPSPRASVQFQTPTQGVWIPGSCSARPGMTAKMNRTVHLKQSPHAPTQRRGHGSPRHRGVQCGTAG